jgi:hypothetical protein
MYIKAIKILINILLKINPNIIGIGIIFHVGGGMNVDWWRLLVYGCQSDSKIKKIFTYMTASLLSSSNHIHYNSYY